MVNWGFRLQVERQAQEIINLGIKFQRTIDYNFICFLI